jgi:hypothetical protein
MCSVLYERSATRAAHTARAPSKEQRANRAVASAVARAKAKAHVRWCGARRVRCRQLQQQLRRSISHLRCRSDRPTVRLQAAQQSHVRPCAAQVHRVVEGQLLQRRVKDRHRLSVPASSASASSAAAAAGFLGVGRPIHTLLRPRHQQQHAFSISKFRTNPRQTGSVYRLMRVCVCVCAARSA